MTLDGNLSRLVLGATTKQWLENVDLNHLVLASGKLVLQKEPLALNFFRTAALTRTKC